MFRRYDALDGQERRRHPAPLQIGMSVELTNAHGRKTTTSINELCRKQHVRDTAASSSASDESRRSARTGLPPLRPYVWRRSFGSGDRAGSIHLEVDYYPIKDSCETAEPRWAGQPRKAGFETFWQARACSARP